MRTAKMLMSSLRGKQSTWKMLSPLMQHQANYKLNNNLTYLFITCEYFTIKQFYFMIIGFISNHNGYNADVKFEGEAKYLEDVKPAYAAPSKL
jgi:hypothetical protein